MPRTISKHFRPFLVNISISLTVAIIVLLLTQDILFEVPPLKRAELSLIDHRFGQRGTLRTDSSSIVIVGISQESYRSLPARWPWPKSYYARLVRNLKRAGARAIGLDIIFASTDSANTADDLDLRRALRETGTVVLAGKQEPEAPGFLLRSGYEDYGNVYYDGKGLLGLVNVPSDPDGVIRRYMPFVYDSAQGKRVPTFSFALLNAFTHQEPAATAELADQNFRYGSRQIPRYDSTTFLINYYGPSGTFRRINFADVLDDVEFRTREELEDPSIEINTFDDPDNGYLVDGTFKDKIVLVGSIMPEDKDLFPVSIGQGLRDGDNLMYGVEIHANVIQSVLDRQFIVQQPFWMTVLVAFGLSLFTFALTAGIKAIRTKHDTPLEFLGLAIIAAEVVIIYFVSMKLFTEKNFLTDMMSPFLTVLGCYVGSTIYNYVSERRQRLLIKTMFSQYVNPNVVEELLSNPEKLRLGGERKEVTVFFSDIENFTRISEKMPPEELVQVLNGYLSAMTTIILSNHGTLDKYEGDAIMAFWGAPIPQDDHALRACRTAIQMQQLLVNLREVWKKEGHPQFNIRIGINSGEAIVGNMGGVNRFDYTVIGDSVNLGARLESANKQYRSNILISESTYRKVASLVFARELDTILVAGKTEPIRVYELIDLLEGSNISSQMLQFTEMYTAGLALYRKREWNQAIRQFECALQLQPNDHPSRMYIERSRLYQSSPPPDDWNGAFVMESK